MELKPDLVIAYKGHAQALSAYIGINNIPVVVLNLKSYEDVKHSMLTIGKIMRKDDKAQKVVANLDKDINATVSKLPKSERSVAILHHPWYYYEKETSIAGRCAKMLKLWRGSAGRNQACRADRWELSLTSRLQLGRILLEKNPQ